MEIGKVKGLTIYTLLEDYSGYNTSFYAQHGISFLIDVRTEKNVRKKILMDVGQSSEAVLHNMDIMHVAPESIDMIFLSHCHEDHVGGLVGMLKAIGKKIPVVAHEDIFRLHLITEPQLKHVGIGRKIKEEVQKEGGTWILTKEPIKLMEGIMTTGEIPEEEREPFERDITRNLYTIGDKGLIEDALLDDISLAIRTMRGLVIISGCSHAGIVSIVKRSIKLMGCSKIIAVVGGFHLVSAKEEKIIKVIESLKKIKVGKIYTGHCTGLDAECMFRRKFGDDFEKLHCGKIIKY